tara:strand:- start:92 stop:679 length:588 start_codon:yes stop_codon:yes gene_type:complete
MGIFDLFKRKTDAEKNIISLRKLRKETIVKEKISLFHDMIISSEFDASRLDQNPDGEGEFGLVKTNPIPVYGIDNIPAYMDKLRYEYISKSGSRVTTYFPVDFLRTEDEDQSIVGSQKPEKELPSSATSSPNIKGHIDVYNLYSFDGKKLSKIYINGYSLITSNKIPNGFLHRDEVPAEKDIKILTGLMKHISKN